MKAGTKASASAKKARTASSGTELRGDVVEVLRQLLAEGRGVEIEGLVKKLVSRNSELERRLALLEAKGRKNERISRDQLLLFMDALTGHSEDRHDEDVPALGDIDGKLREASGIDEALDDDEAALDRPAATPPRQPPARKPAPGHLRRVDNLIAVPPAERTCPSAMSSARV